MIKKIVKREDVNKVNWKDHYMLTMMPNGDIVSFDISGKNFMKWFINKFCPQYMKRKSRKDK